MSLHTVSLLEKKIIKHSLIPLPLIFSSWCLHYKTPAAVSRHIRTTFSTISLSGLGHILMKHFAMFIGGGPHVSRKEIQMGVQKMKFQ